ncbi:RNA-directed DNA polymerase, eukaryota, Reverse transcriptase zinc-binding domain protein [Artemisia annua]|uniref:RNA-directed DNA polymerase, eukaryota, Reverse transcriptase zinc-binding domain protein n=1 Tax=Artemisia annua TaxID=35608 RepID=A0A2U1M8V1_ARTAN|nr:RNA-directed DNA polymerase, eukaryota, Reverse transcriptase zinc-binding domain protein [Artemisia annua]
MAVSGLVVLKLKTRGSSENGNGVLSMNKERYGEKSRNKSTWSDIVGTCNKIEQLGVPLNNLMVRKICRGTQTSFWMDNLLNNLGPLKDCFPRLFALERYKNCLVADRWVLEEGEWQGKWAWTRQPSGRADGDLTKLVTELNGLTLDESQDDRWEWNLTASRKFTVASLCRAIHSRLNANDVSAPPFNWNSWVPRKVNVCAWRVALDRLPTMLNVCQRGINIPTSVCLFCGLYDEYRDHCLFLCPKVKVVWLKFWRWWKVCARFSLSDILKGNFNFTKDKWTTKLFHVVCLSLIWYVWKWRNKILHTSSDEEVSSAQQEDIFPAIQRLSLLWTSNRASKCRFSWCHWIRAPGEVAVL